MNAEGLQVDVTPLFRNGDEKPFQVYSILSDITGLRAIKEQVTLHAERISAFLELNRLNAPSRAELLDYAINACLKITQSQFSFIGLVNPDETEVTIHAWSPSVIETCRVQEQKKNFQVADSGIWGDVLRTRKPLMPEFISGPRLP